MKTFGQIGNLVVGESIDSDGDITISIFEEIEFMDRDDAIELMTHLQNVFAI